MAFRGLDLAMTDMSIAQDLNDYALWLQRAIEYHVRDEIIPEIIAQHCPHHAHALNKHLAGKIEPMIAEFHVGTVVTIEKVFDGEYRVGFNAIADGIRYSPGFGSYYPLFDAIEKCVKTYHHSYERE
jgi:hypothetical protein